MKERKYLNIIDGICVVCVWCSLKATSSLTFRSEVDSEGKEKQASEREIDCGSTGALAFKDVGDFRLRSLVYLVSGLANWI